MILRIEKGMLKYKASEEKKITKKVRGKQKYRRERKMHRRQAQARECMSKNSLKNDKRGRKAELAIA